MVLYSFIIPYQPWKCLSSAGSSPFISKTQFMTDKPSKLEAWINAVQEEDNPDGRTESGSR